MEYGHSEESARLNLRFIQPSQEATTGGERKLSRSATLWWSLGLRRHLAIHGLGSVPEARRRTLSPNLGKCDEDFALAMPSSLDCKL